MIYRKLAIVTQVIKLSEELLEVNVLLPGKDKEEKAYAFPLLTGQIKLGDCVLLNTTAVDLGLGSGGYHFVMANDNYTKTWQTETEKGHIMKLRYSPFQLKVQSIEEPDSPYHEKMAQAESLDGLSVISGSLHSMLIPCVCGLSALNPAMRIAYVMTDGGALPLWISKAVRNLKEKGLLIGTVTTGHAFGGDYEAVNLYSGLLAAKHVLDAQVVIVLMGPGVVGTNTPWGTTALELGQIINAVSSLKGKSYTIARLSFAEKRMRHYGLSHHLIRALKKVALSATTVVLPELEAKQKETVSYQWEQAQMAPHQLLWGEGLKGIELAQNLGFSLSHMGRTFKEDPAFFLAAAAAGEVVAQCNGE